MSLDRARFDRRTVLAAALATGGGAVLAAASRGQGAGAAMAQYAARTKPAGSDLGAIEHVVFLMQENRSFDHYYGTYPGVRGFDDHPKGKLGNFAQAWPGGRDKTLLPFHFNSRVGHRRVHRRPRPQLAGRALQLEQGHQRRLRQHARAVRLPRTRARRQHHGVLPTQGPPLLLRAGRRLHPVRQLPLLGDGADAPEPPHGALGHHRPHGRRRRAGRHHERVARRRLQRALGHHARGARRRRRELEGLQPDRHPLHAGDLPEVRHPQRRHPPLLQPVQGPVVGAVPEGLHAAVPQRLRERHSRRGRCRRSAGSSRRSATTSTRRRHPRSANGSPARCSRRWWPTRRCGPRRCSSTCTTRTTASSTTWCRRWRRRGRPASTSRVSPLPDDADDTAGPIGMSFRVPMLVLSPFSRGGHVASEVFDHTSQLRFLEERFGVKAPNISAWRRHTAGDLTSALHPKRSDPTCRSCPARRRTRWPTCWPRAAPVHRPWRRRPTAPCRTTRCRPTR